MDQNGLEREAETERVRERERASEEEREIERITIIGETFA